MYTRFWWDTLAVKKIPLGTPRCRKDNTEMDVEAMEWNDMD